MNIYLFTRDLSLVDNLTLYKAIKESNDGELILMFIFNTKQIKTFKYKSSKLIKFLKFTIYNLYKQLEGKLNVFQGLPHFILKDITNSIKINNLYISKDYSPFSRRRIELIKKHCPNVNIIEVDQYKLYPQYSNTYVKFTYFYNKIQSLNYHVSHPKKIEIDTKKLFKLTTSIKFKEIKKYNKYYSYFDEFINPYENKNIHAEFQTSKQSLFLKLGLKSIREVYWEYKNDKEYIRKLMWRDFYYGYVENNQQIIHDDTDKYDIDKKKFKLWTNGETNNDLVNAGMKQLKKTGWISNRIRMIVATYLIFDLGIYWKYGELYFAKTLIDYDQSINNGNWRFIKNLQPFQRVKYSTQQKKYDKNLNYIKRWS